MPSGVYPRRIRARLRLRQMNEAGEWRCELVSLFDEVLEASPLGTEKQAEYFKDTYRRYRAWHPS